MRHLTQFNSLAEVSGWNNKTDPPWFDLDQNNADFLSYPHDY